MPLDFQADLADLSDSSPTGENLEFDADFAALDRAAQGKPEQQYGEKIIPAEDPDWKEVVTIGEALDRRTRDLRVLSQLAIARLHVSGLPSFTGTLVTIRGLLDSRWEHVHPRLDPEDGNDPTLRANALLRLSDPGRVLRTLRDLPLAIGPRGRVSWRDIMVANGTNEPEAGTESRPTESLIRGAFADTDEALLSDLREAAMRAADEAAAITAAFDTNAGFGTGPDLGPLSKLLREIVREVERFRVVRSVAPSEDDAHHADADSVAGDADAPSTSARSGRVTALALRSIGSRAEAMHLLDLVQDYYKTNEPSSPLPLLIDRARRLADMGFLDILRDLAPDGLNQAQMFAGPPQ